MGKSTLICGLLGKRGTEDGGPAAQAGVECTRESGKYTMDGGVAVLWDLPGGFTERNPAETYCEAYGLELFDCLVLCYTERWISMNTVILEYAARHPQLNLVIVYTKTDTDVKDMVRLTGASEEEAYLRLRTRVERNVSQNLVKLGFPVHSSPPLLFVDSLSLITGEEAKFQELALVETLVRATAARHPGDMSADEVWNSVRDRFTPDAHLD